MSIPNTFDFRALARPEAMTDRIAVYLWSGDGRRGHVVEPTELIFAPHPEGVESKPSLRIPNGMGRALFDALGSALNLYTPDARMAAETLTLEQSRVDRMLDFMMREGKR